MKKSELAAQVQKQQETLQSQTETLQNQTETLQKQAETLQKQQKELNALQKQLQNQQMQEQQLPTPPEQLQKSSPLRSEDTSMTRTQETGMQTELRGTDIQRWHSPLTRMQDETLKIRSQEVTWHMVAKQAGKREAQVRLLKEELKSGNLEICRAMEDLIRRFRSDTEERAVAQEPKSEVPSSRRRPRASPGKRTRAPIYFRSTKTEKVRKLPLPQQIRGIPVRPQIVDTTLHEQPTSCLPCGNRRLSVVDVRYACGGHYS